MFDAGEGRRWYCVSIVSITPIAPINLAVGIERTARSELTHQARPALRTLRGRRSALVTPHALIAAVLEAVGGTRIHAAAAAAAAAASALLPPALRDGYGGAARHAWSRYLRDSYRTIV